MCRRSLTLLAAAFLCGMSAAPSQAQNTPAASLLVLSKHDHTLSIVDPATLRVIARMPVGNDPHEVIASADGTTA
jgi:YVTN family beta-propeller protein